MSEKKRKKKRAVINFALRSVIGAFLVIAIYLSMMYSTILMPKHPHLSFFVFAIPVPACFYGLCKIMAF